ncbi:MAG: leucyl aminopeptidase [Gemmataceae bacterium]
MAFKTQYAALAQVEADWLIVAVNEGGAWPPAVAELDGKLGKLLSSLREEGDLGGRPCELVPILNPAGIAAKRLLVVGLGQRDKTDRIALTDAAAAAVKSLTGKQRGALAFAVPEGVPGLGWAEVAQAIGVGMLQGCQGPGLHKNERSRFAPASLTLVAPASVAKDDMERGARRADIEGRAVNLARELVNMPPCDLYPESFAQQAADRATQFGFECEIFDEKRLEAERMGSLLGVARGSDKPPRLVVLRHRKGKTSRTLGLVGKGVTFDSGGLSLKTTEQMLDMKCDMAGAAAVLGAMTAIAELGLPVNVLGVMALVENMPSGKSLKLGDVVRARNGKTIEIFNTDAEGRLILADALAYAVEQKADHLVDLATLTGACMIALGPEIAGLMGNDEGWLDRVRAAADHAGERAWQLPMYSLFDDMIKSDVADMKNTGGSRYGGAITAAKLLQQFVGETPWAHLDIAGPAFSEKESKTRDSGGSGCFVRTLVALAEQYEK